MSMLSPPCNIGKAHSEASCLVQHSDLPSCLLVRPAVLSLIHLWPHMPLAAAHATGLRCYVFLVELTTSDACVKLFDKMSLDMRIGI